MNHNNEDQSVSQLEKSYIKNNNIPGHVITEEQAKIREQVIEEASKSRSNNDDIFWQKYMDQHDY